MIPIKVGDSNMFLGYPNGQEACYKVKDPFKVREMFDNLHSDMIDQQKLVLDQLVNDKYNQIHEDAFNKICGLKDEKKRPWDSRARALIGGLWFERKRFKDIMKTQDFEYAKLLKENEELHEEIKQLYCDIQEYYSSCYEMQSELDKIKKAKGEYGRA